MIEPKFPFRQFFNFRFGVNASRFFNLPHPIQTLHNLRDAGRFFASRISRLFSSTPLPLVVPS
jgi:hypothetical protein